MKCPHCDAGQEMIVQMNPRQKKCIACQKPFFNENIIEVYNTHDKIKKLETENKELRRVLKQIATIMNGTVHIPEIVALALGEDKT